MDVLGVTPNELLSGEWKYIDHTEPYIMDIIKREQDFNVSLDYLSENEFSIMKTNTDFTWKPYD